MQARRRHCIVAGSSNRGFVRAGMHVRDGALACVLNTRDRIAMNDMHSVKPNLSDLAPALPNAIGLIAHLTWQLSRLSRAARSMIHELFPTCAL